MNYIHILIFIITEYNIYLEFFFLNVNSSFYINSSIYCTIYLHFATFIKQFKVSGSVINVYYFFQLDKINEIRKSEKKTFNFSFN